MDGRDELKRNVEQLAKETSISILDTISALQASATVKGDDALLNALCDIKWDYIS